MSPERPTEVLHKGATVSLKPGQLWLLDDFEEIEEARNIFWKIVTAANLTVIEHMNSAARGLVFRDCRMGVLYHSAAAKHIWDAGLTISPTADAQKRAAVEARQAQLWADTITGDYGDGTPYWTL